MKRNIKNNKSSAPKCVFCGQSHGVQFAIFNPKFKPFGTACVECEKVNDKLPDPVPVELTVSPL